MGLGDRRFTLMDLAATILAVILLGALFLLGAPRNHGDSRRVQCASNLRQVGLGLLGHANSKGAFPNAGTFEDDSAVHGGDPARSNIALSIADPGRFVAGRNPWLHSWVVDILPYIDNQEEYDLFDRMKSYRETSNNAGSESSNASIGETEIGILRCSSDFTVQRGRGNLSYVANGGFSRWHAVPVGWRGTSGDGVPGNGEPLRWIPPGESWQASQTVTEKLGVMFLGTQSGDQPWDRKTSLAAVSDGTATTLLAGENTLVGVSDGTPYSGMVPTNWASPLPNFCMFIASDDICRSSGSESDCLAGQLRSSPSGGIGAGWGAANRRGTFENINCVEYDCVGRSGRRLTVEGSFPFINSGHSGGVNFLFCDGSTRFLSESIDGRVYAKLITPAGEKLPEAVRQPPLSLDEKAEFE